MMTGTSRSSPKTGLPESIELPLWQPAKAGRAKKFNANEAQGVQPVNFLGPSAQQLLLRFTLWKITETEKEQSRLVFRAD